MKADKERSDAKGRRSCRRISVGTIIAATIAKVPAQISGLLDSLGVSLNTIELPGTVWSLNYTSTSMVFDFIWRGGSFPTTPLSPQPINGSEFWERNAIDLLRGHICPPPPKHRRITKNTKSKTQKGEQTHNQKSLSLQQSNRH